MSNDKKDVNPKDYWEGDGRKLIMIPNQVIHRKIVNNASINQFYIRELGHYPVAQKHYTRRKNGCPEMVLMFCIKGKGRYETKSENHRVLPGQFFILPPKELHQYEADQKDPWSIYWLKIGGISISDYCMQRSFKKCYQPMYVKDIVEIRRLFDELIETLEMGFSDKEIMYANLTLQRLMALLIYNVHENKKEINRLSGNVITFMKDHIADKYVLDELAHRFCYSTSQFSNLFKKETGYSPIDFYIQLKLQQACKLLNSTDMKISQIAREVGYTDPFHFSKMFKTTMDVSPDRYRYLTSTPNIKHNKAHPG